MNKILLDSREFWTTNNGTTYWMRDTKDVTSEISEGYYAALVRKHNIEQSKKFKRICETLSNG